METIGSDTTRVTMMFGKMRETSTTVNQKAGTVEEKIQGEPSSRNMKVSPPKVD